MSSVHDRFQLQQHPSIKSCSSGTLPKVAKHFSAWKESIYPGFSFCAANLRFEVHAAPGKGISTEAKVGGMLATDLQHDLLFLQQDEVSQFATDKLSKQLKSSLLMKVKSRRTTDSTLKEVRDIAPMPESSGGDVKLSLKSGYFISPYIARAGALHSFVRDRRRFFLGFSACACDISGERRGLIRNKWRCLLEVSMMRRDADYALFVLTQNDKNGLPRENSTQNNWSLLDKYRFNNLNSYLLNSQKAHVHVGDTKPQVDMNKTSWGSVTEVR